MMHSKKRFPFDILMVKPDHFRVEYQINPYMVDDKGQLNQVDTQKAGEQWDALLSAFVGLNLKVDTLEGAFEYPDMVFCANQSFPFIGSDGPTLLLSKMHSEHRKGEVSLIERWANANSIKTVSFSSDFDLEGTGDMIWDPYHQRIFGGYGHRTDSEVYGEVEKIIGKEVLTLKLESPHFYHLDTCFAVLNKETVLYVPEAFDQSGRDIIASLFTNKIEVSADIASDTFLGNCFSPDGKHVIMHPTTMAMKEKIKSYGFDIIEVDTSEFMKSGGSVFCMKLAMMHAC